MYQLQTPNTPVIQNVPDTDLDLNLALNVAFIQAFNTTSTNGPASNTQTSWSLKVTVVAGTPTQFFSSVDGDWTRSYVGGSWASWTNRGTAHMSTDQSVARAATLADVEQIIKVVGGSAVAITIPNDATAGWSRTEFLVLYQNGAGAATFTNGAGVTFRGTAPTPAQYGWTRIARVGANEWAYC